MDVATVLPDYVIGKTQSESGVPPRIPRGEQGIEHLRSTVIPPILPADTYTQARGPQNPEVNANMALTRRRRNHP